MIIYGPERLKEGLNTHMLLLSIMKRKKRRAGIKIQCVNCGYVWEYTGKLILATCPSCYHKTPKRAVGAKGAKGAKVGEDA